MNETDKYNEKIPGNLYHYTTIDTLALILRDKKIKFAPLTDLDDLEEKRLKDAQQYGKYVFISSWTEDGIESIPMWNMYAGLDAGVRIKMPAMPFEQYEISSDVVVSAIPERILNYYKNRNATIEEYLDDIDGQYYILKHMPCLYKINYVDNLSMAEPMNKSITTDSAIEEKLAGLGRHKRIFWDFQKEWRYVLILIPIKFADNKTLQPARMIDNLFFYFPFKYYFLLLNEEAFCDIEVVLSPRISDGNRAIVNLLKEKYNPNMKVFESQLKGELR